MEVHSHVGTKLHFYQFYEEADINSFEFTIRGICASDGKFITTTLIKNWYDVQVEYIKSTDQIVFDLHEVFMYLSPNYKNINPKIIISYSPGNLCILNKIDNIDQLPKDEVLAVLINIKRKEMIRGITSKDPKQDSFAIKPVEYAVPA